MCVVRTSGTYSCLFLIKSLRCKMHNEGEGAHAGEGGSKKGSLLELMDSTRSRAGGRLLRQWLSQPLVCMAAITERQDAVADLLAAPALLCRMQDVRTYPRTANAWQTAPKRCLGV